MSPVVERRVKRRALARLVRPRGGDQAAVDVEPHGGGESLVAIESEPDESLMPATLARRAIN